MNEGAIPKMGANREGCRVCVCVCAQRRIVDRESLAVESRGPAAHLSSERSEPRPAVPAPLLSLRDPRALQLPTPARHGGRNHTDFAPRPGG